MTGPAARLAAVAVLAVAPVAAAQSLTGNVGSAGIAEGDRALEVRAGVADTGDAASRVHYDHAFTDWYQLRTVAAFSRPDAGEWKFSALAFENWFQWSEEAADQSGFNGGLRLAYAFVDGGGPDGAEVRLTLTDKFAGRWEWRANVIGGFETGTGSAGGADLGTRFQLTRGLDGRAFGSEKWRLGAELFSEYGDTRDLAAFEDQAHQLGPVVKAEWKNGIYLQSAVRFGLTDGSDDAMFKVFVGREF
jgi:hypothetical protein